MRNVLWCTKSISARRHYPVQEWADRYHNVSWAIFYDVIGSSKSWKKCHVNLWFFSSNRSLSVLQGIFCVSCPSDLICQVNSLMDWQQRRQCQYFGSFIIGHSWTSAWNRLLGSYRLWPHYTTPSRWRRRTTSTKYVEWRVDSCTTQRGCFCS